jgi:hypothetical protein
MKEKGQYMDSFRGLKIPNHKGPDGISGPAALINISINPEDQGTKSLAKIKSPLDLILKDKI